MDNITGTAGDDTINAPVTNPTTGADATTIQTLDVINGGAGKDTLNITSTADFNKSLAGLTVSGVEVVNITGANNLAAVTTSSAAAAAGAKQVQVLDIANLSLQAEQQTVSYVGLAKSATAGTLTISVLGQNVTTASIDASASAATIATAVATAINASTAVVTGTSTVKDLVSASATSGVVTLKFAASVGDAVATTQASTGLVSAGTVNAAAPTISESVASSAEIQSITITTGAANGNTAVIGNIGSSGSVTYTATATRSTSETATDIAAAINTAIGTANNTSADKLVRAEASGSTVNLIFKASVGDASIATATLTGIASTGGMGETRKGGEVDLNVAVNGAQYSTKVVLDGSILTATGDALTAAQNANKNAARDAIKTVLTPVIGDAFEIGNSDEAGEIKLTSKTIGTAAPTITANGRDSATNLLSADTGDAAVVANAAKTGSATVAQQVQYTIAGTVDSTDAFTLYVNGTNYGTVLAGASATPATMATQLATALNSVLGAGSAVAAGGTVTITALTAGTSLPVISVGETDSNSSMTITRADVRDNVSALGTTTTTGAVSIAASTTFADASEVWLAGASGSASVSAASGQTIGFSGVSSMANTVTFAGTNASIALGATASSGTLTLKGAALTSASLAGATGGGSTTPLSLVDGNTTASIKALNVSTTGSTEINTTGMSALTSITHTGAGALTVNRTIASGTNADKLASVTTAGGADQVRIATATSADNAATSIDETVNASVSTGAGNDRVVVATTGSGKTTVDLGDGNDTLILSTIGTGANSLSGGAGNDVFRVGTISGLSTTTIAGGEGTDTLRTSTGTFALVDYTTLSANVSSVETLQLTSAATLDASKVAMSRIEFLASGTNTVTEVSSSQTLAAVRTPVSDASFGIAAVAAAGIVNPTNITAASKGYLVDSDVSLAGQQTVFGDNLNISMTHVAENATVVANGNALDLSITALAATTGATSATDVSELNSQVTVSGDIRTLNATLTSVRGSGTRTDLTATSLGDEAIAKLVVNGIALDNAATANTDEGNLDNLTTIKVSGAGDVTIDAGSLAKEVAKLTSIDLSGMTAFADLNDKGQEIGTVNSVANSVGGYNNLSKSSVTLNDNIAETLTLGGARDTVVTTSKVAAFDTVTGFRLVASAADPLVADADRSDLLKLGGSASTGWTVSNSGKMVVTGSTLDAAVLQASALKAIDGTTNVNNVVFTFGGDTYVYADKGSEGLDTSDVLVRLTGTYNLDLLLTSGVILG